MKTLLALIVLGAVNLFGSTFSESKAAVSSILNNPEIEKKIGPNAWVAGVTQDHSLGVKEAVNDSARVYIVNYYPLANESCKLKVQASCDTSGNCQVKLPLKNAICIRVEDFE